MSTRSGRVTVKRASALCKKLGLDKLPKTFSMAALARGIEVEREHAGTLEELSYWASGLDVDRDLDEFALMIALDHLREFPDYYERLEVMEKKARAFWKQHGER